MQHQLRPYLAQPYQSALKVLDCCSAESALTVDAIAQQTQLGKASVRQVLKVLQSVELITPAMILVREWRSQPSIGELLTESPALFSSAQ